MKYIKLLVVLLLLPFTLMSQTSFETAVQYFNAENFRKAKPLFESYLEANPNHSKSKEYLGDIAGYAKDWDAAIDFYEDLVKGDDLNANYHFKYGGALGMKALSVSKIRAATYIGDIKDEFERAAELDPNHIEVRWALVEFYIQIPGIIGGSETKAIKFANQLKSISPLDGYLANGYVAEYSERPEDAERFYKQAIEIENATETVKKANDSQKKPPRNSLNYQIGKIAAQYNLDAIVGIDCLQAYIKNHSVRDGVPKDWAYFRLAQIYKNQGKKQTALLWIDKALKDRPDFEEALEEKQIIKSL